MVREAEEGGESSSIIFTAVLVLTSLLSDHTRQQLCPRPCSGVTSHDSRSRHVWRPRLPRRQWHGRHTPGLQSRKHADDEPNGLYDAPTTKHARHVRPISSHRAQSYGLHQPVREPGHDDGWRRTYEAWRWPLRRQQDWRTLRSIASKRWPEHARWTSWWHALPRCRSWWCERNLGSTGSYTGPCFEEL